MSLNRVKSHLMSLIDHLDVGAQSTHFHPTSAINACVHADSGID